MLLELRIENLLLIERAELRFGEGLNAITGETGAGKTVLAHSLDLLMGGRARPQIVRPGAEEAWVEGTFSLPEGMLADPELVEIAERLPDEPAEITLGRRVGASGRTSAFVQGRSASAADLRALGARLLAFYGQHEHRKLTLGSAQLEMLDGFAGAGHLATRRTYREVHAEVQALARELAELRERDGARERDLDLLRFELAEIEAVAPDADEERELAAERERLRHAEGLRAAAADALAASAGDDEDGGAAERLADADAALSGAAGVDHALDALGERARALAVELSDLGSELRSYIEGIEAEPGRLEVVEERLDALDRLRRKHGGTVESVLSPRRALPGRGRPARERRGADGRAGGAAGGGRVRARGAGRGPQRGPAQGLRRPIQAGRGRSWPSWRWTAPRWRSAWSRTRRDLARPGRRPSSCGSRPTPGSRPHRFETRPRAASSRG